MQQTGEMKMLAFEDKVLPIQDPRVALTTEGVTNFEGVDMDNFSISKDDIERFRAKFVANSHEKCWVWKKSLDNGYGRFWWNNRTELAHRFSYILFIGKIPHSKQLDHLCRNRACVNPAHLEPVDIKTNVLRGAGVTAKNANKSECLRGHRLDEVNLYHSKRGTRVCAECQRFRLKRWRLQRGK